MKRSTAINYVAPWASARSTRTRIRFSGVYLNKFPLFSLLGFRELASRGPKRVNLPSSGAYNKEVITISVRLKLLAFTKCFATCPFLRLFNVIFIREDNISLIV